MCFATVLVRVVMDGELLVPLLNTIGDATDLWFEAGA
jgi:hypothetical protein